MRFFPLVWAALARNKFRLALTFLSVTVAFILFGLVIGFKASLDHIDDLARGDRLLVQPRFGALPLPEAVKQQLAAIPGVIGVSARGTIVGFYRDPRNEVSATALDPDALTVIPELPISPAQFGLLQQDLGALVISRRFAQGHHLKVGDRFALNSPRTARADGGQTWLYHVVAIVNDVNFGQVGLPTGGFALTTLKALDQGKAETDRYKGVYLQVLVSSPQQGDAIAQRIDDRFANSGTPTQTVSEKFLLKNAFARNGINVAFITEAVAGAGLFMILFLTGNCIAQSVRERIPEFAVMKTIGFSDFGISVLVVAEAMVPCLLGALLGTAIAAWLAHIFPKLLPPGAAFPLPAVTPLVAMYALFGAVGVAALAAAMPARRMARLDIAAALSGR